MLSLPLLTSFLLIFQFLSNIFQYIENWKIFLHNIFEYKAEYLILEDIYATQIPQFVSLQKFYDKYIPLQFLNFDVLTNFLKLSLPLKFSLIKAITSFRKSFIELFFFKLNSR